MTPRLLTANFYSKYIYNNRFYACTQIFGPIKTTIILSY